MSFISFDLLFSRVGFLGCNMASTLLNGKNLYSEDANFSLDYLCVRCRGMTVQEDSGLDPSVAAVVNNGQPLTWVCHCRVTEVTESGQDFQIKIVLVQSNVEIPTMLLKEGGYIPTCTVEWICKTEELR